MGGGISSTQQAAGLALSETNALQNRAFQAADVSVNTAALAAAARIPFDTVIQELAGQTDIVLDVAVNIGRWTIQPGRYKFTSHMAVGDVAADQLETRWFNVTGAAFFGLSSNCIVADVTVESQPTAIGYLTVTVATTVELRAVTVTATPIALGTATIATVERL